MDANFRRLSYSDFMQKFFRKIKLSDFDYQALLPSKDMEFKVLVYNKEKSDSDLKTIPFKEMDKYRIEDNDTKAFLTYPTIYPLTELISDFEKFYNNKV